jgi:hypothetical protein
MRPEKTSTPAVSMGKGFKAHGQLYRVQACLPRDVAQAISDEMAKTGEPAAQIVRRIVTKAIRSKPRLD